MLKYSHRSSSSKYLVCPLLCSFILLHKQLVELLCNICYVILSFCYDIEGIVLCHWRLLNFYIVNTVACLVEKTC